tara:strand:- start:268 stop:690 length:423 start_codon:yes stop_codon:yes gene_type:complete
MYKYKAKLIRVIDGDTVDAMIDCGFSTFKKERIRLYGINTPESRTRDKEEKKRGLAATARLEELIQEGENEFIVETSIDKKGKYGRLLGKLFRMTHEAKGKTTFKGSLKITEMDTHLDTRSYNQILIDEGHAVEYFGGKR